MQLALQEEKCYLWADHLQEDKCYLLEKRVLCYHFDKRTNATWSHDSMNID